MPLPVLPRPTSDQFTITLGEPSEALGARRNFGLPPAMAAVAMFSRTLALEVKRQGIRVNVVTPSIVEGARLRKRIAAGGFGGKLFEKAAAAAHLGVATERDVAEMIGFLASDRAARVTGQVISINGGISAG